MPHITLHTMKPARGARRKSKRLGRGNASGRGSYSTKGQKGQRARSGGRKGLRRLGLRRLVLSTPKARGFKSLAPRAAIVNVGMLDKVVKAGEVVNRERLIALGFIDRSDVRFKILGEGTLAKAFTVRGVPVSASAREKITAAGGSIE